MAGLRSVGLASVATFFLIGAVAVPSIPADPTPVLGAVSNCGGVSPLKNACSGAGLLDDVWWVEVRAAPLFVGTVNALLSTSTGVFSLSCQIPRADAPGDCSQSMDGTIMPGQSFALAGWVDAQSGLPEPAGHWIVSVYTASA